MSVSLDISITVSDADALRVITAYRDEFPEKPVPGETDKQFFIRKTKDMIKQLVKRYELQEAIEALVILDVGV